MNTFTNEEDFITPANGDEFQRTKHRNQASVHQTIFSFKQFGKIILKTAFFISCFFISACRNDEKVIEDWSKKKEMISVGKKIEGYLSEEGKVKAKLTAPEMLQYESDSTEFPKTLHVDFFDDSTKIESWVDSKHGKYFENQDKVYLWDSVVVINVNGDTLESSDLWWDQNKKLFYTDNYAEYRTKDKQIYPGKGLEATQDFKSIIFKQPTGIINASDKEFSSPKNEKTPQ